MSRTTAPRYQSRAPLVHEGERRHRARGPLAERAHAAVRAPVRARELARALPASAHGAPEEPVPPLARALARFVAPGVHITLLWRPHLERAIAGSTRSARVRDPAVMAGHGRQAARRQTRRRGRRVEDGARHAQGGLRVERDVGSSGFTAVIPPGRCPSSRRPSSPRTITSTGCSGPRGSTAGRGWRELLARPRIEPGLFVGLSALDWRHPHAAALALTISAPPERQPGALDAGTDARARGIWEAAGAAGRGRITS